MPKYFPYKIAGYYLYYTAHCVLECMHAHASNKALTEAGSAKFFVRPNGDTIVAEEGDLSGVEIRKIQKFIKENHVAMYEQWSEAATTGYYGENKR